MQQEILFVLIPSVPNTLLGTCETATSSIAQFMTELLEGMGTLN